METRNGNPLTWRHIRAGYGRYALPVIVAAVVLCFVFSFYFAYPEVGSYVWWIITIVSFTIGWITGKVSRAYAFALADYEAEHDDNLE